nr:transporter substrate-binding domain-containing protein [Antrihabitans stalagmiti]
MHIHTAGVVRLSAIAAAAVLLLAACSGSESESAQPTTSSAGQAFTKLPSTGAADTCGPDSGTTMADGVLTIATDNPAYPPWFVDNNPANGNGFEGAVAKTVAEKLGYTGNRVKYVSVPFDQALQPGPKPFDFDINQFTILDERRNSVDFSSPYYAVAQSVVALNDNPAAQADSLADLSGFRLGAQRGSTSLDAIVETLHPNIPAVAFNTNDDAKAALEAGDIDALVVDIPTGFQIAGAQIPGAVLVGQFPRPNEVTEFFGLVLAKGSPLTPCVTAAVDALYADGVLERLADQWLADMAGATILE